MSRITVVGGTGYAGAAIVAEAVRRGHTVRAVSRSVPAEPVEGADYVQGSVSDPDFAAQAVAGADAVVASIPARGDMVEEFDHAVANLISAAVAEGARLVAIGGFSTLRPAAGEPRFVEGEVPEQYRVEAHGGWRLLQALEASPASLDYVYVSPAARFGAWVPGEATGAYRLGGEVALTSPEGSTFVSAPDLALAVVDLIESGTRSREHVGVAQ